ncbi:hypothetical protein MCUN1_002212 [Malassezia cuniculi]|uniref:Uncharacterized protein n=1 Tax=Malassezia cuniculi TaxID=948313 RepID=A0AAF0ER83_9BASI|nr:hypothetical protein MCUN1_002212 [Malassezia cuniculi]
MDHSGSHRGPSVRVLAHTSGGAGTPGALHAAPSSSTPPGGIRTHTNFSGRPTAARSTRPQIRAKVDRANILPAGAAAATATATHPPVRPHTRPLVRQTAQQPRIQSRIQQRTQPPHATVRTRPATVAGQQPRQPLARTAHAKSTLDTHADRPGDLANRTRSPFATRPHLDTTASPASPTVHVLAAQRSPPRTRGPERHPLAERHSLSGYPPQVQPQQLPPLASATTESSHHTPRHTPSDSSVRQLSRASTPASSPLGLPPVFSSTPLSHDAFPDVADAVDAKHERKLLDLEITNKSLLSINATLEATKLRQSREIRSLRQKLVHGRFASTHSEDVSISFDSSNAGTGDDDSFAASGDGTDVTDDDDAPVDFAIIDKLAQQDVELEKAHVRCRNMISYMIEEARTAMLTRPETVGGKVLHASELSIPTSQSTDSTVSLVSSHRTKHDNDDDDDDDDGDGGGGDNRDEHEARDTSGVSFESSPPHSPADTRTTLPLHPQHSDNAHDISVD